MAEAPVAAQLPSSPNRPLNILLGVFLAGLVALGGVFSAELLKDTVHTPRELEAMTGAPVLATVPANSRKMLGRRRAPKDEIEGTQVAQLEA